MNITGDAGELCSRVERRGAILSFFCSSGCNAPNTLIMKLVDMLSFRDTIELEKVLIVC